MASVRAAMARVSRRRGDRLRMTSMGSTMDDAVYGGVQRHHGSQADMLALRMRSLNSMAPWRVRKGGR